MSSNIKAVISASRRTDIPAFYMEWFMACISRGYFEVINPFNRRIRKVSSTLQDVHTIVFWSKNFDFFMAGGYGERLEKMGYHLFFNYTLNSISPLLEPQMPPLVDRLAQMTRLCKRFDVRAINWRFDPICFFRIGNRSVQNNLDDFSVIADKAAAAGIQHCITSFVDLYPKVIRRAKNETGFAFVDPGTVEKVDTIIELYHILMERNIALQLCCEKEILSLLPLDIHVRPGSCIPSERIMNIYGGHLSLRQDPGQRKKLGCTCKVSVDIGSYDQQPCYHNCLFCYANPSSKESVRP